MCPELLVTGDRASWSPRSPMTTYIDEVTLSAIERARLEDTSQRRYTIEANHLRERFSGFSIADSVRFHKLESTLQNIAAHHGKASATTCRTVLSKYILQQLIRDEVITGDTLRGMSIDLDTNALHRKTPKRGGQALSQEERERLVTYLLKLDTAKASPPWTTEKASPVNRPG